MDNIVGCVVMVAVTFPLSFFVARACLKGVIRLRAPRQTARSTRLAAVRRGAS